MVQGDMSAVDDLRVMFGKAMDAWPDCRDFTLYMPPSLESQARESLDKLVESGCYPLSVPTSIVVVGNKSKKK